ncbi:hypothetical protein [Paenibacillus periandrae]|uniref:hypothetical protein n=1 Tax=Paenibacillus periandrae TaxID=1761741 RepID=UPI001F09F3B5|nr:hypothetical protein [Paenibacillus periandrae]
MDSLNMINERDLDKVPALYHLKAITYLLSTVPIEFRSLVLNQIPFKAVDFPLAADSSSISNRRLAIDCFNGVSIAAKQLNCPGAAIADDEYALWLELRDPENFDKGLQHLEAKLRHPKPTLRFVHLGLQFGIKLDLIAVEQEIERQIALNGGITQDAAIARFALAFTQNTPEDVAKYITRHTNDLSKHLDKKSISFLEIEMLSRAGYPERANERLDLLLLEGLSEAEESRLKRVIAEAEGTDPIEARKLQFNKTDSLSDLAVLVDSYEAIGDWVSLCVYGEMLFERTRSVSHAEQLANALSKAQNTTRLIELIKENIILLNQSKNQQLLYCWSLYHEGLLLEANNELAKIPDNQKNANSRALQVNLGIALGDWHTLSMFIANELHEKESRNAQEMIAAAQLAFHLGSFHAKELVFEAVAKGKEDTGILAAAYFLATNAGWEDNQEVSGWIQKAAELSGEDGPIKKFTLSDLMKWSPEWNRKAAEHGSC